jgi:TPR repeat protein
MRPSSFVVVILVAAAAIVGCASSQPQPGSDEQASLTNATTSEASSDETPRDDEPTEDGAAKTKGDSSAKLPTHHVQQLDEIRARMRSCGNADADACAELARLYAIGAAVPADGKVALDFARRTCEIGETETCRDLAMRLVVFEETASFSAQTLEDMCDETQRDIECRFVAKLYLFGRAVEHSPRKAAEMTRDMCEKGDDAGCAVMLEGVRQSSPGARPWSLSGHRDLLEMLCDDGRKQACLELGEIYAEGAAWGDESISRDIAKAKEFSEKGGEEFGGARITVYSKPKGEIVVDGDSTGTMTPGTVSVTDGEHTVSVKFEGGVVSEEKLVRARSGSRIKLFYRKKSD